MKAIVFGFLVIGTLILNSIFDRLIDPVMDNIAVQQVEDSEEAVAAVRAYDGFSNSVPLVTWGFTLFVGVAMFGRNIFNTMRGF